MRRKVIGHSAAEDEAVGACVSGIMIGEQVSDIAGGYSAEGGVHNGVKEDIGIRVTEQPLAVGDGYTADDACAAFDKAMDIVAVADTEGNAHVVTSSSSLPSLSSSAFMALRASRMA